MMRRKWRHGWHNRVTSIVMVQLPSVIIKLKGADKSVVVVE